MNISILVCYSLPSRTIGLNKKIPWNLPSERDLFKKICKNKYVIIGRTSYEEIGHALSYCTLVIVSTKLQNNIPGCVVVSSVQNAIEYIQKNTQTNTEILVAGGQSIYEQTLPLANKIYATEIKSNIQGDTFFPKITDSKWKKTLIQTKKENHLTYDYILYEKLL